MRISVVALIAALSASPALSQCLTAKNAEAGISVTLANGDITTMRAIGADMYQIDEIFQNGTQHYRYHALYSTYNMWYAPVLDEAEQSDSATRVDWGVDLTALPLPTANTPAWSGNVVEYAADGTVQNNGLRAITYFAGDPIVVGNCSYEVVMVATKTSWENNPRVQLQTWAYLPSLGVSFIIGWSRTATAGAEYFVTTVTDIQAM